MHNNHPMASLLLALAIGASAHAAEETHRSAQAHEHGAGTLNIALEGNTLMIELASPAMNIVGFEHAPRDEQQRQAVIRAATRLRQGETLFLTPRAAACTLKEVSVESGLLEAVLHGGEGEGHADFEAAYRFECSHPARLEQLTVKIFETFPATEELDVQLLSEQGQRAAELTAAKPQINF